MSKQKEILAVIKSELSKVVPIKDVILFGSQIDGKARAESDFDILIISKKKLDWLVRKQIGDICSDISIDYDILIDYKIIAEDDMHQKLVGMHPLIQDAINYGLYA